MHNIGDIIEDEGKKFEVVDIDEKTMEDGTKVIIIKTKMLS